jgi:hypothetical protein
MKIDIACSKGQGHIIIKTKDRFLISIPIEEKDIKALSDVATSIYKEIKGEK